MYFDKLDFDANKNALPELLTSAQIGFGGSKKSNAHNNKPYL